LTSREDSRVSDPSSQPGRQQVAQRPKAIVLILIDALRADHLGTYGSTQNLTPSLDALARRAYLFENAWATSSWTRSSVASLFTSQYPGSLGVLGARDALPPDSPTLAELLKAHGGYQCVGISTNRNAGENFGYDKGFGSFFRPSLEHSYPDDHPMAIAEGVTTEALEWLRTWDGETPFFMFLHYVDPHDPYLPHPGLLSATEPAGRFDGSRRRLKRMKKLERQSKSQITEPDLERIRYLYAGEVKYCDRWIGKLAEGLQDLGIMEEALLIVTADHGESLWDHGRRGHGWDLYEETLRVPLLVKWPEMEDSEAARITDLVSLIDVSPTILAAAGIPVPREFQGRSLLPLLKGKDPGYMSRHLYAEIDYNGRNFEAIRNESSKLIRDRTKSTFDESAYELFDLSSDPGEKENLTGRAPEVEVHLKDALRRRAHVASMDPAQRRRIPLGELDPDTLKALRGLGYIED